MFYTCAVRFDVTENFRKFLVFWWSKKAQRDSLTGVARVRMCRCTGTKCATSGDPGLRVASFDSTPYSPFDRRPAFHFLLPLLWPCTRASTERPTGSWSWLRQQERLARQQCIVRHIHFLRWCWLWLQWKMETAVAQQRGRNNRTTLYGAMLNSAREDFRLLARMDRLVSCTHVVKRRCLVTRMSINHVI